MLRKLKWIAALFAIVITVATATKAKNLGSPDFKVFYTAAQFAHTSPELMYRVSPDRYLYPPATAIFLEPFAFSDNYEMHRWIWHFILGTLLFLLCADSWASLLAMLLLTRYLTITFFYGQINLPLIALMAAAGASFGKNISGFFWAFATCLKIYPAVLFPAYLVRGRRKAILTAGFTMLVVLLLPFLYFGWQQGIFLYGEFLWALKAKGLPLHSHNQSISSLLLRLFTDQKFHLHSVDDLKWTLYVLPVWLLKTVALCIGGCIAFFSWKIALKRGTAAAALSAAAFSMLFLSHIVWKDYILMLYFPLKEILTHLPRRKAWIYGGIFLSIVTLSAPDVFGFQISSRLDAACVHLFAAILVWTTWKNYPSQS